MIFYSLSYIINNYKENQENTAKYMEKEHDFFFYIKCVNTEEVGSQQGFVIEKWQGVNEFCKLAR